VWPVFSTHIRCLSTPLDPFSGQSCVRVKPDFLPFLFLVRFLCLKIAPFPLPRLLIEYPVFYEPPLRLTKAFFGSFFIFLLACVVSVIFSCYGSTFLFFWSPRTLQELFMCLAVEPAFASPLSGIIHAVVLSLNPKRLVSLSLRLPPFFASRRFMVRTTHKKASS